jgi:hypothetical protein
MKVNRNEVVIGCIAWAIFFAFMTYVFFYEHFGVRIVHNSTNASFLDYQYRPPMQTISASKSGKLYIFEGEISYGDFCVYAKQRKWNMKPIQNDHVIRRYNWKSCISEYTQFDKYVKEKIETQQEEKVDSIYHVVRNGLIYDNWEGQIDRQEIRLCAVYDFQNNKLYVCYRKPR